MIRQAVLRALEQARYTTPRAAVVLAAGLAAPLADGAPGDLDPTFGDAGRIGLTDSGDVWSLELGDDGSSFIAGGDYYYCYWGSCFGDNFTRRLESSGEIDLDYTHPDLPGTLILAAARQPDDKLVGTGPTFEGGIWVLTVFRLLPNGELDATFGEGGLARLGNHGLSQTGMAVVVEPDGRIVIAGTRGNQLLVMRLLEDGTRDAGFGDDGMVVGPGNTGNVRLVRTADGGYRITTTVADVGLGSACHVVGLAADGTRDQGFGTNGVVDANPDMAGSISCQGLAIQPDGRLLVAASASDGTDTSGVVVRLVPDGSSDATFAAAEALGQMSRTTALALDADGKVLVAGEWPSGMAGAVVARLNADGALDTTYGNAGATWIDVPSWQAQTAVVNDMAAGADGSLTVAGSLGGSPGPFVARLTGDGSADAAGVVSMTRPHVITNEGEAQAVVTVRRAGGKSGAVSVAYRTVLYEEANTASPGTDFEAVTGELTWADGDMTDREITVPIGPDGPVPEGFEWFWLAIESTQDGTALGGQATLVEIAADGAPAGQIALMLGPTRVREGGVLDVLVERAYYAAGRVSVTLAASGAATPGQDFELQPSALTWEDGEIGAKVVQVRPSDDRVDEGETEELVLTLTDPTGGAILGASTSMTVSIVDMAPAGGGGGGNFGWSMLLALCAGGLRRLRR